MAEFFTQNIIAVFFFYGLSFFSMGLAIMLESGHSSELEFARALRPLAGFGLVHGSHEWFEMFLLIHSHVATVPDAYWISAVRLIMLSSSFLMLVAFGIRLIAGPARRKLQWGMLGIVIGIWIFGLIGVVLMLPAGSNLIVSADVYTRYALAIPGAALTTWGLLLQRRAFYRMEMKSFGRDVSLAALAFALYGGFGQLFASPSAISVYINADVFIRWFGFPVQVFRAVMACIAAVSIIRSLRAFEVENNQQINRLREAQLSERRRLEALRGELLHRTVKAQESERQRIALELHDEIGQTLTALGLGLRGMSETVRTNPQKASQQALQLEGLAVNSIAELQHLVTGLHPPQLDELGLLAALRGFANETNRRYGLPVSVSSNGPVSDLSPELRVVLFRICQEAISNIIRHAAAKQAAIRLVGSNDGITLTIEDNGQGFEVEKILNKGFEHPCWGLLGMQERAALIGGECLIISQPGKGTLVEVSVPLTKGTGINA